MRSYLYLFVLFCLAISSCSTKRNLTYFSDLPDTAIYKTQILNQSEAKIQPGDLLGITVNTLSPESNLLFSNGPINSPAAADQGQAAQLQNAAAGQVTPSYEVDKAGNINFPVIGKIQLAGLTKDAATDKLYNTLKAYVKNPIINVRFINFRISVVGEVTKPSVFNVQNAQVNVLEALSMAGDMTLYGKRENVMVIRQNGDVRTMARLNLNSKSVFNSPYFNLQQNDIVYVETDKTKQQLATSGRTTSIIVASATIVGILLSRLLF